MKPYSTIFSHIQPHLISDLYLKIFTRESATEPRPAAPFASAFMTWCPTNHRLVLLRQQWTITTFNRSIMSSIELNGPSAMLPYRFLWISPSSKSSLASEAASSTNGWWFLKDLKPSTLQEVDPQTWRGLNSLSTSNTWGILWAYQVRNRQHPCFRIFDMWCYWIFHQ